MKIKLPRCIHCGGAHSSTCLLKEQGDKELRREAQRRTVWSKLQQKYGVSWWKYVKV